MSRARMPHRAHRPVRRTTALVAALALADATSPAPLGLGLGHRVVAKVAAIHGAQFTEAAAPPGFSRCYALQFVLAADGSDLKPGPQDR